MDASRNLMDDHRTFLRELGVVSAKRLREARHGETVLVAGAKAATQTPPIRSGRRVIFSTLDDGSGLVDLAFFDDSHDACAHTVFHSWLLLVRGVVQRRGPRSLSVVGSAAWNLADLLEVRREEGLEGVAARLAGAGGGQGATIPRAARRAVVSPVRTDSPRRPVPRPRTRWSGSGRSACPPGTRCTPGPICARGRRARGRKEVVAPESGECGMTILCVRFQLPPMYEAALPQLLGLLEEFTPVVEALPPTARWPTCGAPSGTSGATPCNWPR